MTMNTPPPNDPSLAQGHVRVRVAAAAAALLFPPGMPAANDSRACGADFASLLETALDAEAADLPATAAEDDPAKPEASAAAGAIVPPPLDGLAAVAVPAVPEAKAEAAPEIETATPATRPVRASPGAGPLPAASIAGPAAAETPAGAATEMPSRAEPAAPAALTATAAPERTVPAFATAPTAPAPPPHPADLHVAVRVGAPGFDEAFAARVSIAVRSGSETASITLNPPNLGPVGMRIEVSGGEARVHFAAEQPLTREAIADALPRLRDMLAAHGLDLTGSSVGADLPRREAPAAGGAHVPEGEPAADAQAPTIAAATRLVDTFA